MVSKFKEAAGDVLQMFIVTMIGIAIAFSVAHLMVLFGLKEDNAAEEAMEDVIEHTTGLQLDLSPD